MKRLLGWLAAVVLIALVGAGAWFRPAFTPPEDLFGAGRGVASLEQIRLGGQPQWVLIRGADRSAPILLVLHGSMPLIGRSGAFQRPLETRFVVVEWDRRGFGKSSDSPAADPARQVEDAAELIGELQRRLGNRRVIAVGHGEGAALGVALARAHPELVRALVAVGLPACSEGDERAIQDSWLRRRAELAGDKRTAAFASAGGGWDRRAAIARYGGMLQGSGALWMRLQPFLEPEYTLEEAWDADQAEAASAPRGAAEPLAQTIPALAAPAFLFTGVDDMVAPALCADRYGEVLQAPVKSETWFGHSAHWPFLEEPQAFGRALDEAAEATADRP